MKISRILSLILVIVFSISMFSAPAYAEDNANVSDIEFLAELGIVKGYEDGELHPEYNITRMEYAALIIRCLGYDGEFPSLDNIFTDVPKDSWGAAAVQFAYDLGIIDGYGDGRFGPDDNIKEVDAVKIIVSALGRKLDAESQGGYPTGYLSVAKKLNVMDTISGSETLATRGYVANLIANALEVSIVEQNYNNNEYTETYGRTILSILGLSRYKGKLTAVSGMNIGSEENVLSDEVIISGRKFKTDKAFSSDFVGEEVQAYIYKYGQTEEKLVAIFRSAEESENLVVQAEDILDKTTLKNFVYIKKNKEETEALPTGIKICYNGTLLERSIYITPERLKPENGYVKLIDTDKDDVFDTAMVKDYSTFVVKAVVEDGIYDIYGNNIIFDSKNEGFMVVVKKDGKRSSWEDIKVGDVLSVAANMEKTVAEIEICRESVSGKVISTAERDGRLCYGLEDGEIYATSEYNNALANGYREALEIEMGTKYTLKLNSFGEIAQVLPYVPGEDEGDVHEASGSERYGFLIDCAPDANGMAENVEIEMLTTNNRLEIFTISSNKSFRFGRMVGSSYKISKENPIEVYNKVSDGTRITRQIVKYVLDEDDNVRELYLADSRAGSANPSVDVDRFSYVYAYNTVSQKYYYDENTAVFLLPSMGLHDYDIRAVTPVEYINNKTTYTSELWDVESDGYINCICIFPGAANVTQVADQDFVVNMLNGTVMFITDIGSTVADDGEIYKTLTGYENGQIETRYVANHVDISELKPGCVIQYGTNKDDLQYAMYADDVELILGYRFMFDGNDKGQKSFILSDFSTKNMNIPRIQHGYQTVTRVDYPMLTHGDGLKSTINEETLVLKYYSESGIVEEIDPMSIVEGSKIFFRKRQHNLREVIVIE